MPEVQIVRDELSGFEALSNVIGAVEDGVLVLDEDGVVVLANSAADRMFRRRDTDLLGTEFGYPVPVGRTAEIDLVAGGANRSVEMRAAVTLIDGDEFRVATFRDITDRVRADRQLRDAIRMREELLAVAAHELKTPVTVIAGMAITLEEQWADLDEPTRTLMVGRVASRAMELRDLLAEVMRRRDESEWTASPAVQVVATLVRRALEVRLGETPEVAVSVPADLEVWADGGQVVEMVSNLVENATKYGRPPIAVTAGRIGNEVEIAVSDHGDGVPPEERERVFEMGWRGEDAKRSGAPGSGLGLGIVRRLAEANNGALSYRETAAGEPWGACFVLRLPAGPPLR